MDVIRADLLQTLAYLEDEALERLRPFKNPKVPDDKFAPLFLADADGSNARQVKTGLRFHLMPSWSPDGAGVHFVAGEHYD